MIRYIRGAIVASVALGLGYLATFIGADGSNPDSLFGKQGEATFTPPRFTPVQVNDRASS